MKREKRLAGRIAVLHWPLKLALLFRSVVGQHSLQLEPAHLDH